MLHAEENISLIFQHFHLFSSCYRVLTDELQSAVLQVHPATRQIDLREAAAPQKLNYLKIRKFQCLIRNRPPQQRRDQRELPDPVVEQLLERGRRVAVDQLAEIVVEGHRLEPHQSVIIILAPLRKFLNDPLELPTNHRNFLVCCEHPRGAFAIIHNQSHPDTVLAEIIVLGRLELLPNLALPHRAPLRVEALLVGGGDIAEHGRFFIGRAEGGLVDEVALAQVGPLLVLDGPRGCFGERLGLLSGL